ncbi:synembryn-A isoform X2 [Latimeria chalumnae]|uniref:synembryn-A isoform X2 n=1 Tax=Latimeria chalumnae TaxID=7897 RepID=UPI0006D8F010|nr:PREDICTED: synembryn-A-like isoform X2 [Latimeria chalumnae]|eukprot:XP_014341026.1 PREDICTED: synembryn-A-like isoform X2 [Latimeria chalumnae]
MELDAIFETLDAGDQNEIHKVLTDYNKKNSQCFFFSAEEREKRKFKRKKYRERAPESDSDYDSDKSEDPEVKLRQKLGEMLVKFLDCDLQPSCHLTCLETIRILSRDKFGLPPFITKEAMRTLARHAGIHRSEGGEGEGEVLQQWDTPDSERVVEALKCLCNIVYNSLVAQDAAVELRLVEGLVERLKLYNEANLPHNSKFYDLRLLFLLTALKVELRRLLARELRGISLLTDALENTLKLKWADVYEVVTEGGSNSSGNPLPREEMERVLEILKILFNVTFETNRRDVDEEEAALYRHLAAILRYCLLINCEGEDRTEEFHGHAVNLLVNLPLMCLDVLLMPKVEQGSVEYMGMNMDTVEVLLNFMDRRLDRGHKLRELLTPVLNLLTESARVHRETRKFLRMKILPPLRDVVNRPEVGDTLRNKLVRLMTHVDTDVKRCAAELLFVLCKENVSRFVKYTGYGNAAGLLAARGLLAGGRGEGRYSEDEDTDTEEYREARADINPVTGRVEEKQPDPMEGMTEEQKEDEAMKLVNMFNKLSRDQIIRPMAVTAEGKLAPLENHVQRLQSELLSSESDSDTD